MSVVAAASLAGNPAGFSQDRWAESPGGAIVLDGASSFAPAIADANQYVDTLLNSLIQAIRPESALRDSLRIAIADTANLLNLRPGESPSSTVAIAREHAGQVEFLALGDSAVIACRRDGRLEKITDERLSTVAAPLRSTYKGLLRSGNGFGHEHRDLLRRIQLKELAVRNSSHGYWIAEADPSAATRSIVRAFDADDLAWWILITDGAERPITHLAKPWPQIAQMDSRQLEQLLHQLQQWEREIDPTGALLPRSKRHDDKTIVVGRRSPA